MQQGDGSRAFVLPDGSPLKEHPKHLAGKS